MVTYAAVLTCSTAESTSEDQIKTHQQSSTDQSDHRRNGVPTGSWQGQKYWVYNKVTCNKEYRDQYIRINREIFIHQWSPTLSYTPSLTFNIWILILQQLLIICCNQQLYSSLRWLVQKNLPTLWRPQFLPKKAEIWHETRGCIGVYGRSKFVLVLF